MLRYKTETRPGLVALYDIQPGNGAGQFLQPWSPHGVVKSLKKLPYLDPDPAYHHNLILSSLAPVPALHQFL